MNMKDKVCEYTQECLKVIKEMRRNKAPGLHGLPIDFYDIFWPLLGTTLLVYLVKLLKQAN